MCQKFFFICFYNVIIWHSKKNIDDNEGRQAEGEGCKGCFFLAKM